MNEMKEFVLNYSVNVHVPAHDKKMAIKKANAMFSMFGKDKIIAVIEE